MAKKKEERNGLTLIETDIQEQIYRIRGYNVMLDSDLASLYDIETKVLNQSVRRNIDRFPEDFMFQLTDDEWGNLRSQIVTASWGGRRNTPYVFTEHGVLMLSSVLNSKRAIQVNIRIMRIFNQLRTAIMSETDIRLEIERIKRSLDNHDKNIELVFQYLDELNDKIKHPPLLPDRERVGYKIGGKE